MLSFILSTIIFFVASYFLHRFLDNWGLDKGRARTLLVMAAATIVAYGAARLIEYTTGQPSLMDTILPSTFTHP